MGEKERNSSFFTDVFVSVNFWTGKDGKDGQNGECAKVTLWFIHQVIDLNNEQLFIIKINCLLTFLT